MFLGWVNSGAQSSISFSFTFEDGLHSNEWVESINEGSTYEYSDKLNALKIIYTRDFHPKVLISYFGSLTANVFRSTFDDVIIDNVSNQQYITRDIRYLGIGLSSQYFFKENRKHFYLVGEVHTRFQLNNQERITARPPGNNIIFSRYDIQDIGDKINANLTTAFLGMGCRLYERRFFGEIEYGLSLRPFGIYNSLKMGSMFSGRLNFGLGFSF